MPVERGFVQSSPTEFVGGFHAGLVFQQQPDDRSVPTLRGPVDRQPFEAILDAHQAGSSLEQFAHLFEFAGCGRTKDVQTRPACKQHLCHFSVHLNDGPLKRGSS